jgi:hypothetical protein
MIQSDPEDLEAIRARIQKMSDAELREYGRAAAHMADPRKNHGKPNPAFKIQLEEARAEWSRRHPAKSKRAARNLRLSDL